MPFNMAGLFLKSNPILNFATLLEYFKTNILDPFANENVSKIKTARVAAKTVSLRSGRIMSLTIIVPPGTKWTI